MRKKQINPEQLEIILIELRDIMRVNESTMQERKKKKTKSLINWLGSKYFHLKA